MNAWHAATVGLLMALATGCGSGSSSPQGVTLRGTYLAVADGPYTQMTFPDGEHYTLQKSSCSSDCVESGTYAIDVVANILALRNSATGQIQELPFTALQSAPVAAPTLLGARLHTLDLTNPSGSLTSGSGGGLTSGGGSLTSGGGSLTQGSGGSLSSGQAPLVSDGGALSFGDAGGLTSGSPAPGFNAGMQPFASGDGGGGFDSGTDTGADADAGAFLFPPADASSEN